MSYQNSDTEKTQVQEVHVRRSLTKPRTLNGDGIQPCLNLLWEGPLYGNLRQNLLTGRPEINRNWDKPDADGYDWQTLSETDLSVIRCYMSMQMVDYRSDLDDALRIYLSRVPYDPVTTLLDSLVWDRKPRLETFLTHCLGAEDTPYTRLVSMFIFFGAVKRAYEPGCKFDFMPVLVGPQGGGKSTIVRLLNLCDDWYREVTCITGKEAIEGITGGWVCEFSEMIALQSHRDVEAMKAFVSRQKDIYRRPYERSMSELPRRVIMIGTTNNDRFLLDKTGNRRFLPVEVGNMGSRIFSHMDSLKEYIRQCYAETVFLYRNGEAVTAVPPTMHDEVRAVQESAVEDDWRVGVIREYMAGKPVGSCTCVIDVFRNAIAKGSSEKPRRSDSLDIAKIIAGTPGWVKQGAVRFPEFGIQQGYRKIAAD